MAGPRQNGNEPTAESGTRQSGDPSVAELVRQLSDQTTRLAQQEVQLAKAELATKGKQAGIGAGMFGGAGLIGLYAVGAIVAAAILLLGHAVTAWLSALIVGVVLGALAGGLALTGRSRVKAAVPPVPEAASDSVRADVRVAKDRAEAGRR